jgi:hypothetical protein
LCPITRENGGQFALAGCSGRCTAEAPWPTYWHGRELNARGLGRLLNPFGIQPQNISTQTSVLKGYVWESFKDAWERYLPPESATPLQGP